MYYPPNAPRPSSAMRRLRQDSHRLAVSRALFGLCAARNLDDLDAAMTAPRSLAEAFTTELAFSKGAVPIRLRVSERARRVALRIDGRGQAVELVLPHRTP